MSRVLAIIAVVASAVAALFGYKAKAAQAQAAGQRADIAEAVNTTRRRMDHDLHATREQHRREDADDAKKTDRDYLDNSW
jgi:type II secretory pathway pseudopilin PulG